MTLITKVVINNVMIDSIPCIAEQRERVEIPSVRVNDWNHTVASLRHEPVWFESCLLIYTEPDFNCFHKMDARYRTSMGLIQRFKIEFWSKNNTEYSSKSWEIWENGIAASDELVMEWIGIKEWEGERSTTPAARKLIWSQISQGHSLPHYTSF